MIAAASGLCATASAVLVCPVRRDRHMSQPQIELTFLSELFYPALNARRQSMHAHHQNEPHKFKAIKPHTMAIIAG